MFKGLNPTQTASITKLQEKKTSMNRETEQRMRKDTHVCPISCAMVKAVARPMSSLMLQLLSGSHIPPTGARPYVNTHKRYCVITYAIIYICRLTGQWMDVLPRVPQGLFLYMQMSYLENKHNGNLWKTFCQYEWTASTAHTHTKARVCLHTREQRDSSAGHCPDMTVKTMKGNAHIPCDKSFLWKTQHFPD